MKAVEATLNPDPEGNQSQLVEPFSSFVNLTSTQTTVYVNLFNRGYNNLNGESCSKAPCTPQSGGVSFQFHIIFPKFLVHNPDPTNNLKTYDYCPSANNTCSPFMAQAVIEFLDNGTCQAHPQGASQSPPAPSVPKDDFLCSNITGQGASFEWIVDSSGLAANRTLTNMKLEVNGVTNDTWYPFGMGGIFKVTHAPSTVSMNDTYAQSVFAGPNGGAAYGNFYSGAGFLSYTGAENLSYHTNCSVCGVSFTSEYSNTEYTAIPSSGTSFNQTYDAGVYASYYVGESGSVSNPTYTLGPPVGEYAQLQALTLGTTACVEDAFEVGGPLVNGTIAIYGNSTSGHSSSVQVSVSSSGSDTCTSGSGWTTVYTGVWSSTTANWVSIGSATGIEYMKVTASYSGGGADIYIGAISVFMGSYSQSETNSSSGVTHPSYIIGIPDSNSTELQALTGGSSAWIKASLGTEYSGDLVIDGFLANGTSASVSVQYWNGVTWSNASCNTWSSSESWIDCGGISQALYVEVTVTYSGSPTKLYIDAVYVE
jgi:hypothetical protein